MNTRYLLIDEDGLNEAGALIREGKLVAFPTETVYGLGVNAFMPDAVKSVYKAKGRPSDNPLIVHVFCKEQIYEIASRVSSDALKIIETFMPGSLTVVLPKKKVIPDCVTAGLDTVAIRMPFSEEARSFLEYCDVPVAAPSANTSSRPSPTSWEAVYEDMDGKIDAVLKGADSDVGIESTVLDLSGDVPRILRPGVVTPDEIAKVLNTPVRVVTDPKEKVNSPGVRYRHYAPSCQMALNLDGDADKLKNFYDKLEKEGHRPVLLVQNASEFGERRVELMGETDREVMRNFFALLRKTEKHCGYIIASYTKKGELADSILNRMYKSAGNNIL